MTRAVVASNSTSSRARNERGTYRRVVLAGRYSPVVLMHFAGVAEMPITLLSLEARILGRGCEVLLGNRL